MLAAQTRGARKLGVAAQPAIAPLRARLAAARPAPLAALLRLPSTALHAKQNSKCLVAACTAVDEEMAAAAAAAGGATAKRSFLLPEELRAQFNQQVDLMAVRVPKQSTNQYMKRLSK